MVPFFTFERIPNQKELIQEEVTICMFQHFKRVPQERNAPVFNDSKTEFNVQKELLTVMEIESEHHEEELWREGTIKLDI